MPDILCGPLFEDLPTDGYQRTIALCDAEETLRLFYKMMENILTVKEEEERVGGVCSPESSRRHRTIPPDTHIHLREAKVIELHHVVAL